MRNFAVGRSDGLLFASADSQFQGDFAVDKRVMSNNSIAQDYVRPVVGATGPPPIRNVDPGVLGASWLEAIAMTDYEVWIAEDSSQLVYYQLWVRRADGWREDGLPSGGMQPQFKPFKSLKEAELFAELRMLLDPRIVEYKVISHVPDMRWKHVATFDSRSEADEFLDDLLRIIGDYYVGDIRSITVIPSALRK